MYAAVFDGLKQLAQSFNALLLIHLFMKLR